MAKLSPDTKKKLTAVVNFGKTIFHWSFIPTVLYLGFRQGTDPGMPPITIMSLLWQ
ncbi:Mitochondrial import receptor subunit TOM7 [Daphnia magna]|uniref:Mitochondrial import receptor subunit TOM7 homolog n=1 Tax=Daphnia magna TaxID=35525 RepID=A0A164NME5_9CRUS|nr:Mitochondrial import receptor subunit TOM7 [Daphnia magna]